MEIDLLENLDIVHITLLVVHRPLTSEYGTNKTASLALIRQPLALHVLGCRVTERTCAIKRGKVGEKEIGREGENEREADGERKRARERERGREGERERALSGKGTCAIMPCMSLERLACRCPH